MDFTTERVWFSVLTVLGCGRKAWWQEIAELSGGARSTRSVSLSGMREEAREAKVETPHGTSGRGAGE